MLLIALMTLAAVWLGVLLVVLGVCADAARGDRALPTMASVGIQSASERRRLLG